jgi:hypothetical protein
LLKYVNLIKRSSITDRRRRKSFLLTNLHLNLVQAEKDKQLLIDGIEMFAGVNFCRKIVFPDGKIILSTLPPLAIVDGSVSLVSFFFVS